jgi:hypothetical protein
MLSNQGYKHTLRICNTYCFPLQQWLTECASVLSYIYIASLVTFCVFSHLRKEAALNCWIVISKDSMEYPSTKSSVFCWRLCSIDARSVAHYISGLEKQYHAWWWRQVKQGISLPFNRPPISTVFFEYDLPFRTAFACRCYHWAFSLQKKFGSTFA